MPDRFTDPVSAWAWLQIWGSLALAWLLGETARAGLSGAAGGLIRWLMDSRRRVRDGLVSVVAGVIFAAYLSPVALRILEAVFGALGPGSEGTAGFAAGLWGMSLAKVLMGVLDIFIKRTSGGGGDVA